MKIRLNEVLKQFDKKQVLKGLTLNITEGQFVALLGPSGCGKTTLLNAIAGLQEIDGGSIEVDGTVWSSKGYTLPSEKRNVGMVFQDFALWPHLTVFENVAFGLKVKKVAAAQIKQRVFEVLEMVQMADYSRQLPHQLSGGQKQRVAIARALAPRPTVMLMDEPLSSLDAKLREQMRWDFLHVIRQAGITTVYVTHDQVEALSMADHVVLMNGGHVEQQGSPTDLYQRPMTTFAATFVGASNLLRGKVVENSAQTIRVDCAGHIIQVNLEAHVNAPVASSVTVMVRPNDLRFSEPGQDERAGALVTGTIVQRAYHGMIWQYRIAVPEWQDVRLEVWDVAERPAGTEATICFPNQSCRVVTDARPVAATVV